MATAALTTAVKGSKVNLLNMLDSSIVSLVVFILTNMQLGDTSVSLGFLMFLILLFGFTGILRVGRFIEKVAIKNGWIEKPCEGRSDQKSA